MEAIFNAKAVNGKLVFDNIEDLYKYCIEQEGIVHNVSLKPIAELSEKTLMFNFLFGPVITCAVNGFTAAGYEGVDKVKARYMLEAEFCKAEIYNSRTKTVDIYTESVAHMSKKRLHKFITDVLFFLETELGQRVPDAEAFKARLESGRNYESVKSKK